MLPNTNHPSLILFTQQVHWAPPSVFFVAILGSGSTNKVFWIPSSKFPSSRIQAYSYSTNGFNIQPLDNRTTLLLGLLVDCWITRLLGYWHPGPPGLNFHPVSSHSHPSFEALAEDMYIHPTAILQFGPVWSKKKNWPTSHFLFFWTRMSLAGASHPSPTRMADLPHPSLPERLGWPS